MTNIDSVNSVRGSAQAPRDSVSPQQALSNSAQDSIARAAVDGKTLPQSGKATKAEAADQQPTAQDFEAVVAKLSDFVQAVERDLSFTVDDNTGDTIIVVKDRQTDEVVRQIPSEEVVQLAQKLLELQEELEGSKGNLLEVRV